MSAPTMSDLQLRLADVERRIAGGSATAADLDAAVDVALVAREAADGWRGVETHARRLITAGMAAMGGPDRLTTSGGVIVETGKPAEVVSYDSRALDVACHARADVAVVISPYRRRHTRAGTLRIIRGNGHAGDSGARP